ncbi:MAG: CsbD family protein [Candidatus Limnocylindria bacterium]
MDSDRVEGPLKEAGGKIKEAWGDATDNPDTEAEGQMDQAEGKIQNTWGETKDDVRDAVDDDR